MSPIAKNLSRNTLSEDDAQQLLTRLVEIYVRMAENNEKTMVLRKMSSTLVAYFLHKESKWVHCVKTLVASFSQHRFVQDTEIPADFEVSTILDQLSPSEVNATFLFCSSLVEETLKFDSKTLERYAEFEYNTRSTADVNSHHITSRTEDNLQDVLKIVHFVLQGILSLDLASADLQTSTLIGEEALKTFVVSSKHYIAFSPKSSDKSLQAWAGFSRAARYNNDKIKGMFQEITNLVLECLFKVDVILGPASEAINEIVYNFFNFLTETGFAELRRFMVSGKMRSIIQECHDTSMAEPEQKQLMSLLLVYAAKEYRYIFLEPRDSDREALMDMLHFLNKGPGVPGIENEVTPQALEFWSEMAENILDEVMDTDEEVPKDVMSSATAELAKVITDCWPLLRYPPDAAEWESEDRTKFHSYRADFADFMLSVYQLLGPDLCRDIISQTINYIQVADWSAVEVGLFALGALSEAVEDSEACDMWLKELFTTEYLIKLRKDMSDMSSNPLASQTLVETVSKYASFFERNVDRLEEALKLLWQILKSGKNLAAAPKAIYSLSSNCRVQLLRSLDYWIQEANDVFQSQMFAEPVVCEKLFGAIACITQANPDASQQRIVLDHLASLIHQSYISSLNFLQQSQIDEANQAMTACLRFYAAIGRGLRQPDDAPIDLDENNKSLTQADYWDTTDQPFKDAILSLIESCLSHFPTSISIVGAAVDVLKSGLTEKKPGPFNFPPSLIVQFISHFSPDNARLDAIFPIATGLLSAHFSRPGTIASEAHALITHMAQIPAYYTAQPTAYDPDIAYNTIDFFTRLIPTYISHIFPSPPPPEPTQIATAILPFTLNALTLKEPLPKHAAASFWSTLLAATSYIPNEALSPYAPHLAAVLARQLGGGCSRSDIEKMSEALRKFVFRFGTAAGQVLEQAVMVQEGEMAGMGGSANSSIGIEERRLWVRKVVG